MHVLAAHIALLALVGLTPLLLFSDSLLVDGIVELYTAIALTLVAQSIRPGEARHWVRTMRWAAALAALPLFWLIIQLLPLPINTVSGSIWQSAAGALGTPFWSSVTIDPGLTLLAFFRYASTIAIGLIAAAASIDRQQAEKLFLLLGLATFLISLISVAQYIGVIAFLGEPHSNSLRSAAEAGGVYGVVLFAGIIILVVERHLTRRTLQDFRWQFLVPLAVAGGGFAVCALATFFAGSDHAVFAAACGFATVVTVQFIRRIGLDWRAAVTMAGAAVIGAAVIVSTKGHPALADFSMRYVAGASADLISVADRIVGEVGIGGSGGGTFRAIYQLYGPQNTVNIGALAPTSAAQIAIELGRPALWIIVVSMIALILLCASGGFDRGRDFFYSTAGAGVGVATLVLIFCNIALNNLAISILFASILGLGFAQRLRRTL